MPHLLQYAELTGVARVSAITAVTALWDWDVDSVERGRLDR